MENKKPEGKFEEIYNRLHQIMLESNRTSRGIYFDLIKLLIMVSVGAIPIIAILVISQDVKPVTFLILMTLLFLLFSIAFGITSLAGHAVSFKKRNRDASEMLKEILVASAKGEADFQEWLAEKKDKLKMLENWGKALDYKWSIFQLAAFILASLTLFLTTCKILYTP